MGWPVVLTPQSQDDLREIVTFIARDSPERAQTFGNLLLDKALSLGAHPEMGRVLPGAGRFRCPRDCIPILPNHL